MFRLLGRVQLAYLGLFALVCGGVFAYEATYIWPMQHCEQAGGWWSAKFHECATPMPIWRITGRGGPDAAKPGQTTPAAAATTQAAPTQAKPTQATPAKKP